MRIELHCGKAELNNRPGGGYVFGSSFAGYVPLASQNPYSIIVYSVVNYRHHRSHFCAIVIVIQCEPTDKY